MVMQITSDRRIAMLKYFFVKLSFIEFKDTSFGYYFGIKIGEADKIANEAAFSLNKNILRGVHINFHFMLRSALMVIKRICRKVLLTTF